MRENHTVFSGLGDRRGVSMCNETLLRNRVGDLSNFSSSDFSTDVRNFCAGDGGFSVAFCFSFSDKTRSEWGLRIPSWVGRSWNSVGGEDLGEDGGGVGGDKG